MTNTGMSEQDVLDWLARRRDLEPLRSEGWRALSEAWWELKFRSEVGVGVDTPL